MNRNFKGIYASLIREFVSLKRSMGFKYIGGEFVLTLFDRFTHYCPLKMDKVKN